MDELAGLRADCDRCAGLYCIALAFDRGASFAFAKPAGVRCLHLAPDDRCAIHAQRTERGFAGCVRYDCAGAGQRATALTSDPAARLEAFRVLRELHELRLLLRTAKRLDLDAATEAQRAELERALETACTDRETLGRAPLDVLERATRELLRSLRPFARAQPRTIVHGTSK